MSDSLNGWRGGTWRQTFVVEHPSLFFGLDKHYLAAFDPSFPQVHAEPAIAVFRMEADGRSASECREVIFSPSRAEVQGHRDARGECRRWGAMSRQDHSVLNNHIRHFELCIVKQGVLLPISDLR